MWQRWGTWQLRIVRNPSSLMSPSPLSSPALEEVGRKLAHPHKPFPEPLSEPVEINQLDMVHRRLGLGCSVEALLVTAARENLTLGNLAAYPAAPATTSFTASQPSFLPATEELLHWMSTPTFPETATTSPPSSPLFGVRLVFR